MLSFSRACRMHVFMRAFEVLRRMLKLVTDTFRVSAGICKT